MMQLTRRPINNFEGFVTIVGIVSVVLGGGVVTTACSFVMNAYDTILADAYGADTHEFFVFSGVVLATCAAIGAAISVVRGVIVRAGVNCSCYFLDLLVGVGTVVVGGIGGVLIGSAHDGNTLLGGAFGTAAGLTFALGSLLVARSE